MTPLGKSGMDHITVRLKGLSLLTLKFGGESGSEKSQLNSHNKIMLATCLRATINYVLTVLGYHFIIIDI